MDYNVRKNRPCRRLIRRDVIGDRKVKALRVETVAVVLTINVPSPEDTLEVNSEPMSQGAFARVALQQAIFSGVELRDRLRETARHICQVEERVVVNV